MDATSKPYTWVVGLDLRARSDGALHFVSWLARASSGADRIVVVHVLEDTIALAALRERELATLEAAARDLVESALAAHAPGASGEIAIVSGAPAEVGLEEARAREHGDVLVIGRAAPREGGRLFRLGRVARRVLRCAGSPTIVVPRDLPVADPGQGPVLVATDLTDTAAAALDFGAMMAARLRRSLSVVHVLPEIDEWGARVLPAEAMVEAMRAEERTSKVALQQWCELRGCGHAERSVVRGSAPRRLVELAREHEAVLLVAGSRRLSTSDRILVTSVASELAATAPCAVAVVPPPEPSQSR